MANVKGAAGARKLGGDKATRIDLSNLSVVAPPEGAPVNARLHVWFAVPGLSTGVASQEGDNLEITVSAEVYQSSGSIWFRALVDGKVALPSDVVFKSGRVNFDGVRSFSFVQQAVGAGQHIIEIQATTGTPASIRDRVLTVHSCSPVHGPNRLKVAAAVSGPEIVNSSSIYQDIPGLSTVLTTANHTGMAIVFSAECRAASGRMLVRALIDGIQANEVIFCEAGAPQRSGTRAFTFVAPVVQPGEHEVKLQWKSQGGSCRLGDRTMVVSAADLSSQRVLKRTPPDPVVLSQIDWVDLSSSTTIVVGEPVSNVAITFSGEVRVNRGRIFLRALVDNRPALPSDVTLVQGGDKWRATSHVFVMKNLAAGRHTIRIQGRVDPQTSARVRRNSVRIFWKRRSGSDFVQPFLGMVPTVRTYRLLVVGLDPLRPGHPRPSHALLRNTFEGDPGPAGSHPTSTLPNLTAAAILPGSRGPNLRDWLAENSGGVARLGEVRYVGCLDSGWYIAPPEHQGDWYWDNMAWEQMWKDALAAADPEVDFHAFDQDGNNRISKDELLVAIVRPQNDPYGTLRGSDAMLDGSPTPLHVPVLDLYLSSYPARLRWGVGVAAHELCHLIFGARDLYDGCPAISPGIYSVMDQHWLAMHLDPFEKMKNGCVQPLAVNIDTLGNSTTLALEAVELRHKILVVHDTGHVGGEYFIVENRFPGGTVPNYDGPLGRGAVVIWQIFENLLLVQNSAICPGDPRFIRLRAVLRDPAQSEVLTWADGSPTGFRVSAPIPNSDLAQILFQKV